MMYVSLLFLSLLYSLGFYAECNDSQYEGSNYKRITIDESYEAIDDIVLSEHFSFQSQVNKENTTYIIKKGFNLENEIIHIPNNCILRFEGGYIYNGVVDFNGCYIEADNHAWIFRNLVDFNNLRECSIKWFGAKGDGATDDTQVFRFVINRDYNSSKISKHNVIYIPSGIYVITDCINPEAYEKEDYAQVSLIGVDGFGISPYEIIDGIKGSNRSVIYCKGRLTGKPFIYAPSLLKHISFRGEDNENRTNYMSFLAKYDETTAISISSKKGYATNREFVDVQVHFFGTGIEEKDSFGGNWNDVEVHGVGYGVKIIPQRSNITMQTINRLEITKCKYDGLLIDSKYNCSIHFEDLICQQANCLYNNKNQKQQYYNIKSNQSISINNGYCENGFNNSNIVNLLLTGGEGKNYTITNFRFLTGIYEFDAPVTIVGSLKSFPAVFKMHSYRSYLNNIVIEDIEDYEKTVMSNVTVRKKAAVINRQFMSFDSAHRPYWNRLSEGEFYYDTDLKQLVYWNGSNWSNLDGVNVDNVKITTTIGDSKTRKDLKLSTKQVGFSFFDTSLNQPVYWTGYKWVDAMGKEL